MNTTSLNNRIRNIVPPQVEAALLKRRGKYTDMVDIFHCIQLDANSWVGVAGDGGNGSYEHFALKLVNVPGSDFKAWSWKCSDVGYGDTLIALRDVLTEEVA
jgi:hypothetical protein